MISATCDYLNIPQGTTMRDLLKGVGIRDRQIVYVTNGVWKKQGLLKSIDLEVWGGGAKGGNGTQGQIGYGGGSGFRAIRKGIPSNELPDQVNIIIGAGGREDSPNGGPSSFGNILSASGGKTGGPLTPGEGENVSETQLGGANINGHQASKVAGGFHNIAYPGIYAGGGAGGSAYSGQGSYGAPGGEGVVIVTEHY